MLLQPRSGAGGHVVDFAVGPEALVEGLLVGLDLRLAVFDLANHVNSLERYKDKFILLDTRKSTDNAIQVFGR